MSKKSLALVLIVMLGTSCTETDFNFSDNASAIFEHDYPYAQDFLRYHYSKDRLEKIFLVSEVSERKFMSFQYSDTQQGKIIKVFYDNGDSPVITFDTLIFNDSQLIEIINKSIIGDSVLGTIHTQLDYNVQGHLIKITSKWNEHPSNCIKEIEYSDYVDNQFTRVDYKWCSNLENITTLKYDKKISPFKLIDKNIKLVLLNHFGGTAYNFITESNIIDIHVEDHNQPTLLTHTYKVDYRYNLYGQPKSSTMTSLDNAGTEWTNFYNYK